MNPKDKRKRIQIETCKSILHNRMTVILNGTSMTHSALGQIQGDIIRMSVALSEGQPVVILSKRRKDGVVFVQCAVPQGY